MFAFCEIKYFILLFICVDCSSYSACVYNYCFFLGWLVRQKEKLKQIQEEKRYVWKIIQESKIKPRIRR